MTLTKSTPAGINSVKNTTPTLGQAEASPDGDPQPSGWHRACPAGFRPNFRKPVIARKPTRFVLARITAQSRVHIHLLYRYFILPDMAFAAGIRIPARVGCGRGQKVGTGNGGKRKLSVRPRTPELFDAK